MSDRGNTPPAPDAASMGRPVHKAAGLPQFDVRLAAPNLAPWLQGNCGIPGFTSIAAARPGPHVGLMALIHGNEISGAIALAHLLQADLRPECGRLTFCFANVDAFTRFDPAHPTASRFIDEDLNRLWDPAMLDGPRQSNELERARRMRPLIDRLDVLLDLHSMLWPADPLILSGDTRKGRDLALAIGMPPLVVADAGHLAGRRLIDYGRFAEPAALQTAILVEAGQHWEQASVDMALASIAGLLRHLRVITDHPALPPVPVMPHGRYAQVTMAVTAATSGFGFVQDFRGGDVVPRRNTLIGMDGSTEVRTPHDDCLLVMPSLRPSRGHTAVRLARFIEPDGRG
jgi:predicted deacylase